MGPRLLKDRLVRCTGRHPWCAPLVCGVAGLTVAAAVTLTVGWPPAPIVHDEFSYLLASDTFAHGRVTNPTPAFWQQFESFHILLTPSYASKYPPGSSLVMALGQMMTGTPIVGVWAAYALMCAALAWMLQAWTRPRWALWGALTAALWFGGWHAGEGYWTSSYWGGATAAAGGALVLGAIQRLRSPTYRGAAMPPALLALGILVLANTRPFEGFLLAVPVAAGFLVWCMRSLVRDQGRIVARGLLVMVPLLALGATLMADYNRRVTGSALRFPYVEHASQYETVPLLLGLRRPVTPAYRHQVMRCFYTVGEGHVEIPSTAIGFVRDFWSRSRPLRFGLVPFFVLPLLLLLPTTIRRDGLMLPAACSLAVLLGWAVDPRVLLLHYAAPMVGAYLILLTLSARRLHSWRTRGFPLGRRLVQATAIFTVASLLATILLFAKSRGARFEEWQWQRLEIRQRLAAGDRRHLILVAYGPHHVGDLEWVYNDADLEASPVIWARSMGARADLRLIRHFSTRRPWHLRVDDDRGPFTLTPVDTSALATESASAGHPDEPVAIGPRVQRPCPLPP